MTLTKPSIYQRLALLAVAIILSLPMAAQQGAWKGDLMVENYKMAIIFHFTEDSVTLDVPMQGANGIKGNLSKKGDEVTVDIPSLGFKYVGRVTTDSIVGSIDQIGIKLPLTLKPDNSMMNRPQTPQPPFPYTTEEVTFGHDGVTLRGTLTLPEKASKATPVVLMVTGSGLQNRDEEMFGHKPFAVLADALARNGIASLRYDDRGFGEQIPGADTLTTYSYMADAKSGVDFLRKRFSKVGILGHSEGGTIALMLAGQGATDFIVSLAGMATSGRQTIMEQNKQGFAAMGITGEQQQKLLADVDNLFQQIVDGKTGSEIVIPASLHPYVGTDASGMASPAFRTFLMLDPASAMAKIKCPVMAINGKKDTQVDAVANLGAIEKTAKGAQLKVKAYDDLNHLFQHCTTGAFDEYAQIPETMSPEVIADIVAWIAAQK